jgi:predicted nuclease of restriction endonuclease-like (RecB) superfamily
MSKLPDKRYIDVLNLLKEKIRKARYKAALTVNYELLKIYWEVGKTILEQQKEEGWGAKIIDRLAVDLKVEFPDFKGLSIRNLKYMRAFADAYPDLIIMQQAAAQLQNANIQSHEIMQGKPAQINSGAENLIVQPLVAQLKNTPNQQEIIMQPMVAQIPWTHHTIILDRAKTMEERLFYIGKTLQNGWSKTVLSTQIENNLYKRQGKAITNFKETLPAIDSDLAQETFKNPYIFDFLMIGEETKERELERALVNHLKKFMLELGKGYAYVGNQFNIEVKDDEYFLDLLFYNYILHRFVIFELKVGEFKPEYAGKLNFYINTVDAKIKNENDNCTIGMLLCKTPNELVIGYSLKGITTPIGVSEYQLKKVLPKELKSGFPSIEELETEIDNEYEILKTPADKKLDTIKQKLAALKSDEIKTPATKEFLFDIIDNSIVPFFEKLLEKLKSLEDLFLSAHYIWQGKSEPFNDIEKLAVEWKDEEFLKSKNDLFFLIVFGGLKKAGVEAFSTGFTLNWVKSLYFYGFTLINHNNQNPFIKKLYHEQLSKKEINSIVETVYEHVINEIGNQVEQIKKDNNG